MRYTSELKIGHYVQLDFPPITGRIVAIRKDRTAATVDMGAYVKEFPCHRLTPAQDPVITLAHHAR